MERMTCCCGTYTVEQVIKDYGNGPEPRLRIRMHGGNATDLRTADEVIAYLAERKKTLRTG